MDTCSIRILYTLIAYCISLQVLLFGRRIVRGWCWCRISVGRIRVGRGASVRWRLKRSRRSCCCWCWLIHKLWSWCSCYWLKCRLGFERSGRCRMQGLVCLIRSRSRLGFERSGRCRMQGLVCLIRSRSGLGFERSGRCRMQGLVCLVRRRNRRIRMNGIARIDSCWRICRGTENRLWCCGVRWRHRRRIVWSRRSRHVILHTWLYVCRLWVLVRSFPGRWCWLLGMCSRRCCGIWMYSGSCCRVQMHRPMRLLGSWCSPNRNLLE